MTNKPNRKRLKFYKTTVVLFSISLLTLLLNSCQEKDHILKYDLENLGATIKLPDVYRIANKERLDRVVAKKDEAFKNELLGLIQRKKNIKLLIDTLNPYKFILITEKPAYVKIDTISMYLLIDSERKKSSSRAEVNDSTYFVGSRLDSIAGYKFIESKHKRKSGNRHRVGYTYIISDAAHTTGISFFSPEEQDVRKYIKTIFKK